MTEGPEPAVRDLVRQAIASLELDPDGEYGCTAADIRALCAAHGVRALPAGLETFLLLAGGDGSQLAARWFPQALVGFPTVFEGRSRAQATAELAGISVDWAGKIPFYFDVSGTVAWVEAESGPDPPVMYLTEASPEPQLWRCRLTDWLRMNQPGAVLH